MEDILEFLIRAKKNTYANEMLRKLILHALAQKIINMKKSSTIKNFAITILISVEKGL